MAKPRLNALVYNPRTASEAFAQISATMSQLMQQDASASENALQRDLQLRMQQNLLRSQQMADQARFDQESRKDWIEIQKELVRMGQEIADVYDPHDYGKMQSHVIAPWNAVLSETINQTYPDYRSVTGDRATLAEEFKKGNASFKDIVRVMVSTTDPSLANSFESQAKALASIDNVGTAVFTPPETTKQSGEAGPGAASAPSANQTQGSDSEQKQKADAKAVDHPVDIYVANRAQLVDSRNDKLKTAAAAVYKMIPPMYASKFKNAGLTSEYVYNMMKMGVDLRDNEKIRAFTESATKSYVDSKKYLAEAFRTFNEKNHSELQSHYVELLKLYGQLEMRGSAGSGAGPRMAPFNSTGPFIDLVQMAAKMNEKAFDGEQAFRTSAMQLATTLAGGALQAVGHIYEFGSSLPAGPTREMFNPNNYVNQILAAANQASPLILFERGVGNEKERASVVEGLVDQQTSDKGGPAKYKKLAMSAVSDALALSFSAMNANLTEMASGTATPGTAATRASQAIEGIVKSFVARGVSESDIRFSLQNSLLASQTPTGLTPPPPGATFSDQVRASYNMIKTHPGFSAAKASATRSNDRELLSALAKIDNYQPITEDELSKVQKAMESPTPVVGTPSPEPMRVPSSGGNQAK